MKKTFDQFMDFVGGLLGAVLALLYFLPPYDDCPPCDDFLPYDDYPMDDDFPPDDEWPFGSFEDDNLWP